MLYNRYPHAVAVSAGVALALATATLTVQVLGEQLSGFYLMSVSDPEVRASLNRANAETESLARSFVALFRAIWIFGSLAVVLGGGVAWLAPPRSAVRWLGILALVLAIAALWAHWTYINHLRWS